MGVQRDVLNPLINQKDKIVFHLKKEQRKKAIKELQEFSAMIKRVLPEIQRMHSELYDVLTDLKGDVDDCRKEAELKEKELATIKNLFEEAYGKAFRDIQGISREEKRKWGL